METWYRFGDLVGHPLYVNSPDFIENYRAGRMDSPSQEIMCLSSTALDVLRTLPEGSQVTAIYADVVFRHLRVMYRREEVEAGPTDWWIIPTPGEHLAYEVARHHLATLEREEGADRVRQVLDRLVRRFRRSGVVEQAIETEETRPHTKNTSNNEEGR